MALRLAVATEDFGQPLRTAISRAAQNPVHGLRLNARTELRSEDFGDTALRQLRLYVEEHQMKVAGLMYSSRHALYDENFLDQRLAGIRSAMEMVRRLGTSELLIRVGRIPDPEGPAEVSDRNQPTDSNVDSLRNPFSFAPAKQTKSGPTEAQQFRMLCDIVNDLAAFGTHHGAVLQLQLTSFEQKRAGKLLSQISAGPVRLVFDPAACVMTGSDAVSVFRDFYQHVGYIRIRDAQPDVDGAGIEVPFDEGTVNWVELIPTLIEADYSGWACLERTGGEQRAIDVDRAVARLRRLLPINAG
ncbi:MAG: sugar phosphate isomerase/epimerase family protein [Planctomycetota bacterium]